ncbi:HEAT repeat domain-containing protein [Streptomyces sp. NPDC091377]|uniref:HEAT repeat domain-containing protein n=1 Tax=Streptomyces sp. NPDC091377 TaxID=3365995 RepID=UPI0037F9C927
MFTGIDDIDWPSLRHAYGSARDVPELLRGLASEDPAERETALDGMYGAVHHQGSVYDSTLACVPFLLALAAREGGRDRGGIVELLVSIGGEADGPDGGDASDDHSGTGGSGAVRASRTRRRSAAETDLRTRARDAVRAGAPVFTRLAGDTDVCVRRAVPRALVGFLDEPARVLEQLQDWLHREHDDRVLIALTEGLGLFALRHPTYSGPALDILAVQSRPPHGPALRLAALGQLAARAPERLPADLVDTVVGLLKERSTGRRPVEPCHPVTDTLARHFRRLRPSDEEGSRLLRTLHSALDDRVPDRIALLNGQLSSPGTSDRCNAVWMSTGLFRGWRGDYEESVALIGAQLSAEEGGLRDAAVSALGDLHELAAPAADALYGLAIARPDLWVRRWERGAPTLGGPLRALARTGDPRTTALLAEVLEGAAVPDDLPLTVSHLGGHAAPLAPALLRALTAVDPGSPTAPSRTLPLLTALTELGDDAVVPQALRLLRGRPYEAPDTLMARAAIRTLGAFATAAREATPVLRGLLDGDLGTAAAGALWSLEGDASAVLPVLRRDLAGRDPYRRTAAAEQLARLGPAAGAALPRLRRLARSDSVWERTAAAYALWRITGAPEPALPVLRSAWAESPYPRVRVAEHLHEMGAAGTPLHDLLAAELSARRRHLAREGGHGSDDIPKDERLLRLCRETVGGVGADPA